MAGLVSGGESQNDGYEEGPYKKDPAHRAREIEGIADTKRFGTKIAGSSGL